MSRNLFSFLRLFVLMIGFAVICLGAFCISTNASACKCNSLPIAYFLLPLGFLLLISGIFWSIYHEASRYKGLFFSIIHGNPRLQQNICTIDRYVPDFYPPSYEDSTDPVKQTFPLPVFPLEREDTYNIPPPLYTESSLEFIEEINPQEQPPPSYEVSVQQQTTRQGSGSAIVAECC
uniref:Transmembrane protein 252 n=1 Tax=Varanus komodoensis TaxID=61221 RepID=A0A8D2KUQ2_VARKO